MDVTRATVTQASPLKVKTDGASTAVAAQRLASYTATLNDRVVVTMLGSVVLVLGKVA